VKACPRESAPRWGRFERCELACKPDPVVDGHLSGTNIAAGLARSTRDVAGGPPYPCSTLLRMGFAKPSRSPGTLVVSYTTVSPLPVHRSIPRAAAEPEVPRTCRPYDDRRHRRSALCCTFRRVAPPGCYPASCPAESGLSSTRRPRPSRELAPRTLAGATSFPHMKRPQTIRGRFMCGLRTTSQMNIVWAPSMISMKSPTLSTPSRPSSMSSSVRPNMSTDILQAQRWQPMSCR